MGNHESQQRSPAAAAIVERIQNSSTDYRLPGDLKRLVPEDEINGLPLEVKQELMEILKPDLEGKEQRPFKWSNNKERGLLRLCCSRQGTPTNIGVIPQRASSGSLRCRCNAHVTLAAKSVSINLQHVTACLPVEAASMAAVTPAPDERIIVDDRFFTSKTLDSLINDFPRWGYSSLVDGLVASTTRRTQLQILGDLFDGESYLTEELLSRDQVLQSIPNDRRGASAYRFSMLIPEDPDGALPGKYFKVTRRATDTSDVVHVTANVSFACTFGDVARKGAPDRHVLALLRQRKVAFNPLVHLHPSYLSADKRVLLERRPFMDWTAGEAPLLDSVHEAAGWDECVLATDKAWQHKGEGRTL